LAGIAGLTNPGEHGQTHFYTTNQDWQTQASLHQHRPIPLLGGRRMVAAGHAVDSAVEDA
jgi:hypothetical protein